MRDKQARRLVSLPRDKPPEGDVNMAFAVKIPGKFRFEYVGPIDEDSAKQILLILAKRVFPAEAAAAPAPESAKAA